MATPADISPAGRAATGPDIDDLAERVASACASTDSSRSSTSTTGILPPKPKPGALSQLFAQNVANDWWLEIQLLFMTVITGIIDAATYITYNVFTTKQTGNFLFVAVYIFGKQELAYKIEQTIAVSIACFFAGSFIFGQLSHRVRTRRRSWLIMTTLFQALLVLAVALVERSGVPGQSTGPIALAVVGLLSFAQAGQVSLAIGVGLAELNTTMITGAIISTLGDPRIFRLKNHARDRRILFIFAYLGGCFIGSALTSRDTTIVYFLAFGAKMFVCASFLFTPGMVADLEKQDDEGTRTPVSHILWGD